MPWSFHEFQFEILLFPSQVWELNLNISTWISSKKVSLSRFFKEPSMNSKPSLTMSSSISEVRSWSPRAFLPWGLNARFRDSINWIPLSIVLINFSSFSTFSWISVNSEKRTSVFSTLNESISLPVCRLNFPNTQQVKAKDHLENKISQLPAGYEDENSLQETPLKKKATNRIVDKLFELASFIIRRPISSYFIK